MGRSASEARQREVELVHASRGRVRAHVVGCTEADAVTLERELRRMAGVRTASASSVTGNALIVFDAERVTATRVLNAVRSMLSARTASQGLRVTRGRAVAAERTSTTAVRDATPAPRENGTAMIGEALGQLVGLSVPAHCEECERRARRRLRLARRVLRPTLGEPTVSVLLALWSLGRFALTLSRTRSPLDIPEVTSGARGVLTTVRTLRTA